MSVQELNRVHRRYIRTSNHFKSAWTFHQFVQGLRKAFPEAGPANYSADFQSAYGELKQVSQNLAETTAATADQLLDRIEKGLAPLVQTLLATDDEVSPSLLRQFFQRVKNYDDNILTQLVKFYLYSQDGKAWKRQRLDKADFLVTKLAEEYRESAEAYVVRDQTFLRELSQGLWAALDGVPTAETEIDDLRRQLRELRGRIESTESIEDLHRAQLVQTYRDFKHDLGHRFFEPKLVAEILETNLALKNRIQGLYRRDEQRIVAEYQQVFELQRDVPMDVQLSRELDEFRATVERFEQQLEGNDVKLEEIAELRQKVRDLVPRLRPADGDGTVPSLVKPRELREEHGQPEPAPTPEEAAEASELEDEYRQVIDALDDSNPSLDPKKVALQPEVFLVGVGPREIVAYRRLFGGAQCDQALEHFVLLAAALRVRIDREVEEIKSLLDDSAVTQEAPIFAAARRTCVLGDRFLRRFEHRIAQCVLLADAQEARDLQRLQVRLMRAWSGLWLMVHR